MKTLNKKVEAREANGQHDLGQQNMAAQSSFVRLFQAEAFGDPEDLISSNKTPRRLIQH